MRHPLLIPVLLLPMVLARCSCDPADGISGLPGTLVGTMCDLRTGVGGSNVEMAVTTTNGGSLRASSTEGGTLRLENVPRGFYDVIISQTLADRTDTRTVPGVEVKSSAETEVRDPACIAGHNPAGTGWVRGKVCNRHTGSWVGAAEVVIALSDGNLLVTTTDEDGSFLLQAVPAGTHVMTVRSATFQRSYEVEVVAGRETALETPASCAGVDPQHGGVQGKMCAPNGTGALSGATAWIEAGNPPVRVSDTTDAEGFFELAPLPPGTFDLHVEQGSYNRVYSVTVMANTFVTVGPSQCQEPSGDLGFIAGYFCSPLGGALTGANVSLDTTPPLEDTTDSMGRFDFGGVTPGQHTVRVTHVSFNQSFTVTVVGGQTAMVIPQQDCGGTIFDGPGGDVQGRLCAPNGTTWLANARVWVDTPGGTVETQSDANGRFTLAGVPPGTYTVHVQAGSFTTDIPNVAVRANEITQAGDSSQQCVPIEDNHRIAVVSGEYDDVAVVLERLGLHNLTSYTGQDGSYTSTLLEDYALMQTYDVIFFNCGLDDGFLASLSTSSAAIQNLRAYVESGKSIYASDWAYDLVEKGWPQHVDFYGDDASIDTAQVGAEAENVAATVVDPGVRNALGASTVAINFNLPGWAVMTAASADTKVYIRGTADVCDDFFVCASSTPHPNSPFTVGFHPSPNAGKVIYTSFHQERQTTQDMDTLLNLLVFEL